MPKGWGIQQTRRRRPSLAIVEAICTRSRGKFNPTATLPGSLIHRGTCGHSNALVLRYYGALTATIHICKIMGTTTRRLRTHGSQSFRAAAILPYYGNGVSPPAGRPADLPLHTQPLATTGGAQLPIRRIIAKTSHPSGALSVRDAAGPVE